MRYFEYLVGDALARQVRRVTIVRSGSESWADDDLRAELLDAFPGITLQEVNGLAPLADTDLVVVPFADGTRWALEDVTYHHLARLADLARMVPPASPVLLFRHHWREGELVPPGALAGRVRRKRLERLLLQPLHAAWRAARLLRRRWSA